MRKFITDTIKIILFGMAFTFFMNGMLGGLAKIYGVI